MKTCIKQVELKMIYLLYVYDTQIRCPGDHPPLEMGIVNMNRYRFLWIGRTNREDLTGILYDKRSCYSRFKKSDRYFIGYMDAFKLVDSSPTLKLGVHKLSDTSDDIVFHWYQMMYRIHYGSLIPIDSRSITSFIENFKFPNVVPVVVPSITSVVPDVVPSISPEERQRCYNKRYAESHRAELNAKSSRYYQAHRAELKAKRDAKKSAPIEV